MKKGCNKTQPFFITTVKLYMEGYKELILENFDLTQTTSFEEIHKQTSEVESVVDIADLFLCLYFIN